MITCPYCRSNQVRRLHRSSFQKMITFLKKIECKSCRAEFLSIAALFTIKLDQGISRLIALKQN